MTEKELLEKTLHILRQVNFCIKFNKSDRGSVYLGDALEDDIKKILESDL